MKKIAVLMSTYNGEKYIKEQIDSILNQKNVDVILYIRDDRSKDSTIDILNEYQKQKKLTWYTGDNLKPARSFLDLLKNCKKADYYAFADQDDYWEDNKLYNAVVQLEKMNKNNGRLYFSSLRVVDSNLNELFMSRVDDKKKFGTALIKNQASGCTMVFDNIIRNFINKCNFDYVAMHDSLIYRIALLYNYEIFSDNSSYICYRQHSGNVLGMTNNAFKKMKIRWHRFIKSECESSETAKELLKLKNISEYDYETLQMVSSYKKKLSYKLKLIFTSRCNNNKFSTNLFYKIKIIFNKI